MVATVQKRHYEPLKTLKMLWFPVLQQWTLPGGSQLPVLSSCIGNSLSRIGDHHPT